MTQGDDDNRPTSWARVLGDDWLDKPLGLMFGTFRDQPVGRYLLILVCLEWLDEHGPEALPRDGGQAAHRALVDATERALGFYADDLVHAATDEAFRTMYIFAGEPGQKAGLAAARRWLNTALGVREAPQDTSQETSRAGQSQ